MDKVMQSLLDKMPRSSNEVFNSLLAEARWGEVYAMPDLARMLLGGIGVTKDVALAHEITEWCEKEGHCPSWLIEAPHVEDPALRWKEEEILRLISLYKKGEFPALGMVIKAVQQEKTLYERFSGDITRLLKRKDEEDREYRLWQSVWWLDKRQKVDVTTRVEALEWIEEEYISSDDPYIAIAYLEVLASRDQTNASHPVSHEILDTLKENAPSDVYAFYKGLIALLEGCYPEASAAFASGSDRRCQLSKAYMLLNGIGVPQDVASSMRILKDYPEDGYALYLSAVARFRIRRDKASLPDEVSELLMESLRLGYQPAPSTLYLIRYACQLIATHEPDQSLMREIRDYGLKTRDRDAIGLFQYDCLMEDTRGDDLDSEEELSKAKISEEPYSPLGNYSMAFLTYDADQPYNGYWEKAPKGLNQSPAVRQWGVTKALSEYLFTREPFDLESMLSLYGNMGASQRDLDDLLAVYHLFQFSRGGSLMQRIASSMVDRFSQPNATDLEKLLLAFLCSNELFEMEDEEVVIRCLKETSDVSCPFLRKIRNSLIQMNLLDDEIPLSLEDDMDPLGADWLDHFIGYHFFHY